MFEGFRGEESWNECLVLDGRCVSTKGSCFLFRHSGALHSDGLHVKVDMLIGCRISGYSRDALKKDGRDKENERR